MLKIGKIHVKYNVEGDDKSMKVNMEEMSEGHFGIRMLIHDEWNTEKTVLFMKSDDRDIRSYKISKINKIKKTNHKLEENMLYAERNSGKLDAEVRKIIEQVCGYYKVGKKFKKSLGRLKITLPKTLYFNEIVILDCKQFAEKNVIWIIDPSIIFIQEKVLANKKAMMVIDALHKTCIWRLGLPSRGFWTDNGR